jgi:hypothetical protein
LGDRLRLVAVTEWQAIRRPLTNPKRALKKALQLQLADDRDSTDLL